MKDENTSLSQASRATHLGLEILVAMDEEFQDNPDRVIAIVGPAYLDSLLEELFRAVFIGDKKEADHLLEPDRALGSNGSRYQLAYCLGLIDKEQRDDLKMIAKIRNNFAHKYDIRSFDHSQAKGLLEKLHYAKERESIVDARLKETTDPEQRNQLITFVSDRRKFQDTVRNLCVSLLDKLNSVCRADASTWYRADSG